MSWYARAWTALAGPDGPRRTGVPAAELLAPLPLACVVLLVVNDWVLKPSSAPGWLTGKLSDVAGLAVFPLVATAALDCVLAAIAKLGAPIDFTLRRSKLAVACVSTGIVFTAMKLSPDVAHALAGILTALTRSSHIVADPTDLVALPALAVAYLHGRRAIARGSYGRLALARTRHAAGRPLAAPFGDAVACGASAANVTSLDAATAAWLAGGPAEAVDTALAQLRR
jgi:hypothetical protein